MFQSLLPTLIFADGDSELKLKGGSNVSKSPPALSIVNFLKPYLARMGIEFNYEVAREGYYPAGGGVVNTKISKVIKHFEIK